MLNIKCVDCIYSTNEREASPEQREKINIRFERFKDGPENIYIITCINERRGHEGGWFLNPNDLWSRSSWDCAYYKENIFVGLIRRNIKGGK